MLMMFGSFLAFETRKIKMDELNDSQAIGACIYNVFLLSLLALVCNFALGTLPTFRYAINAALLLVATTATQLLIFVPKIKNRNAITGEGEQHVGTRLNAGIIH